MLWPLCLGFRTLVPSAPSRLPALPLMPLIAELPSCLAWESLVETAPPTTVSPRPTIHSAELHSVSSAFHRALSSLGNYSNRVLHSSPSKDVNCEDRDFMSPVPVLHEQSRGQSMGIKLAWTTCNEPDTVLGTEKRSMEPTLPHPEERQAPACTWLEPSQPLCSWVRAQDASTALC